jgi:hypothetical protein
VHVYSDQIWWQQKLGRLSEKAFHPHVGKWAVTILGTLTNISDGTVVGEMPHDLAQELGVPKKYIMRSLALLSRPGLVTLTYKEGWKVVLTRDGTTKPSRPNRKPPTAKERAALLAAEKHTCGHCGQKLTAKTLRIDHLVPLAMRGADEAGNWGALCSDCNRNKWHNFDKAWLRYYRGRPVKKTVGVVVVDGFLWPRIDGTIRRQSRKRLVAKANT